jgi:hypothetical protein
MDDFIYMVELEELVASMAEASGEKVNKVAEYITQEMGEYMAELARQYAPKDTGELQSSIEAVHSPGETRVVAGAPHAAYVEFGTWSHNIINPRSGTYEIRPKNAKALKFTASDGREVFTKVVHHPGIPAQQYMARALQETVEMFSLGIANVGVTLVVGE